MSKHILAGEEGALENYLNYLKAGSSDFPIEVMKKAGVDMTQAAYIEDAMKVFEERLTELEALVENYRKKWDISPDDLYPTFNS